MVPAYDELRDGVVSWLQKFGVVSGDSSAADSSKAQQAYNEANNEVDRLKLERDNAENDAKEIFNVHGFGAKGEWKKLDGHCMEKDTGECVVLILKSLKKSLMIVTATHTKSVCSMRSNRNPITEGRPSASGTKLPFLS